MPTKLNGSRWPSTRSKMSVRQWTLIIGVIALLFTLSGGGVKFFTDYGALAKGVDFNSIETILVKQRLSLVEGQAAKIMRIQKDIEALKADISKQTLDLKEEFGRQIDRLIPFITPTKAVLPGG